MKRRILILVSLVVVAAVVVAVCWFEFSGFRPDEPMVQGKRLSYWFTDEGDTNRTSFAPFMMIGSGKGPYTNPIYQNHIMAVRETGTNAIPTLLRLMRARNSSFKLKLMALARKQHWVEVKFTAATNLSLRAGDGMCWWNIGPAGSNAIPALLQMLQDPDPTVAARGAWALGGIHTNAAICVPALIDALRSTNDQLVNAAAWSLQNFGAEAKPALLMLMQDPRPADKAAAKTALQVIDSAAARKAEEK